MITLDMHSRIHIYEQLCQKITQLIAVGALEPGDQLPSVRLLARDLGVNPNTVSKAYQELERSGVICSVAGKGSFVSSADEVTRSLQKKIIERFEGICTQCRKVGVKKPELLTVLDQVYAQKENGI